ncbi:MAG: hypothetical protein Q9204_006165, partial [Flavoplaca sp. TL-2023a]
GKIKALKIEGGDDITDTSVRVKAEHWDEKNIYWTAITDGQKDLLNRVSDGSGGHDFRAWDGHTHSAGATVACSIPADPAGSITSGEPFEANMPDKHVAPQSSNDYATPPTSGCSVRSQAASSKYQQASNGEVSGNAHSGNSSAVDYHAPTIHSIDSRDPRPPRQHAFIKLSSSLDSLSLSSIPEGSPSSLGTASERDDPEYWLQRKRENADERRVFMKLKVK